VKPERDHNARASYRENWWLFGEPRRDLRAMLAGLPRYIATVETSKHRVFPFPDATPEQQARIRGLAEELDAHRKRRQAEHPELTLAGMYNVLEALRAGRVLVAKEKAIHEMGLVAVLKQLHDDLDAAVLRSAAAPMSEAEIAARFSGKGAWKKRLPQLLETLVALGRARRVGDRYLPA